MTVCRKVLPILIIVAAVVVVVAVWLHNRGVNIFEGAEEEAPAPVEAVLNYEVAEGFDLDISVLDENVPQVTRIKITPDGEVMLAATLPGKIYAFAKEGDRFVRQEEPFFEVSTGTTGLDEGENGLTGMALGADFVDSGDVFLLYAAKDRSGKFRNKITRVTLADEGGLIKGIDPEVIFEGNFATGAAHQINGGVGVIINGDPYLLFVIGDGADDPKNSLDLEKEVGKVMLIQRDGSDPLGERPFPDYPKIQALGLRNAYDIAFNGYDTFASRFAVGVAGTDKNDQFVYASLADLQGNKIEGFDFGWDGSTESLDQPLSDKNAEENPEAVLLRTDEAMTFNDIVFYQGGVDGIAESGRNKATVLVSVFGRTGAKGREPGKRILVGTVDSSSSQPELTVRDLIVRSEKGSGELGHPLGLDFDPMTGDIYFGDVLEGKIYQVSPSKT